MNDRFGAVASGWNAGILKARLFRLRLWLAGARRFVDNSSRHAIPFPYLEAYSARWETAQKKYDLLLQRVYLSLYLQFTENWHYLKDDFPRRAKGEESRWWTIAVRTPKRAGGANPRSGEISKSMESNQSRHLQANRSGGENRWVAGNCMAGVEGGHPAIEFSTATVAQRLRFRAEYPA
jgi:hypothetical protein